MKRSFPSLLLSLGLLVTAWGQEAPRGRQRHETPSGLEVRYAVVPAPWDTVRPGVYRRPVSGLRTRGTEAARREHYIYHITDEVTEKALALPAPFDRKGTRLVDARSAKEILAYNQGMEWEEQYTLARRQRMAFFTLQMGTGIHGQGPSTWYLQPRALLHLPTGLLHRHLRGLVTLGVGPRLPVQQINWQNLAGEPLPLRWEGYAQAALPLNFLLLGYRYQWTSQGDLDNLVGQSWAVVGLGRPAFGQPFYLHLAFPFDRMVADFNALLNPTFYRLEAGINLLNLGNGARAYARKARRRADQIE